MSSVSGPEPTREGRPSPGRNALLVEDDETIRGLTRGFLESMGFGVTEAASGQEGLMRFGADESFDLLVVDLVMPHMTGRQMIDRLLPETGGVPILIMSGATAAGVGDLLERPDIDFLAKPFRASTFTERVEELLADADMARRTPTGPSGVQ